jgi:hypothetical protein
MPKKSTSEEVKKTKAVASKSKKTKDSDTEAAKVLKLDELGWWGFLSWLGFAQKAVQKKEEYEDDTLIIAPSTTKKVIKEEPPIIKKRDDFISGVFSGKIDPNAPRKEKNQNR